MSSKKINILFIGGTGRSGTNITKEIIGKHPEVATLPFEYRFSIDPFGLIDTYSSLKNNWSPYVAHAKVSQMKKILGDVGKRKWINFLAGKVCKMIDPTGKRITPPPYFEWEMIKCFPNYKIHIEQLIDDLIDFKYEGYWPGERAFRLNHQMQFVEYSKNLEKSFRNFFRSLINDALTVDNKTYFVEDNTWNLLYAKEIQKILPEAKFLHIVRDPRDVVASFMQQRWTPTTLDQCIKYYSSLMDKILDLKKKINNDSILEIRLEDMIQFPEERLREILQFICLDFTTDLMNNDLSHSNSGRWREEFNGFQKEKVNAQLKKYIEYFDYNVT